MHLIESNRAQSISLVAVGISFKITLLFLLFLGILGLLVTKMASRFKPLGESIVGANQQLTEKLARYISGFKSPRVYEVVTRTQREARSLCQERARYRTRSVATDASLNILTELYSVGLLLGSFAYDSRPGRVALRDVNLEIRRNEALGILGRRGAGKSTLLGLLLGLLKPGKGRIEVEGIVVDRGPER